MESLMSCRVRQLRRGPIRPIPASDTAPGAARGGRHCARGRPTAATSNHLGDEGTARIRQAYGDHTWQRLVALERRRHPDNVLSRNQNIPPNG
jgi:hypothetical protein